MSDPPTASTSPWSICYFIGPDGKARILYHDHAITHAEALNDEFPTLASKPYETLDELIAGEGLVRADNGLMG